MNTPSLLPYPQNLALSNETCALPQQIQLHIQPAAMSVMEYGIRRLRETLNQYAGAELSASASSCAIRLTIDAGIKQEQAYQLIIRPDNIHIGAGDPTGLFYGVATLIQLIEQYGRDLRCMVIDDYPDLPARGVLLDISRDKVPTMQTLYDLIDLLASWKINQLQLYAEHTFAYQNHEIVWRDASPISAEEIRNLDAYCRERFIELVPNQNSFGHMHRWLIHEPYQHLAEAPDGFELPWGEWHDEPFSLSPAVPASLEFIDGLYAELLPNFSGKLFNIGCDETWDLGQGRSKELVERYGKGRVYLDFLLSIYKLVKKYDRMMMFWGDIMNQYPDLVPEVPKDAIALEWWYEDVHEYPRKTRIYAEAGVPFYVCPGTSSWGSIAGRTQNCITNIQSAIKSGLANGAIGMLNTDWGDMGHWQPLPVSYTGFAYGAGLGWAYEANLHMDIPHILNTFAFRDQARIMGQLAYELGNAYQKPELTLFNGSLLFWFYHHTLQEIPNHPHYRESIKTGRQLLDDPETLKSRLEETRAYIDAVMAKLNQSNMRRNDADLIRREFQLVADMLLLGIDDALRQLGVHIDKGEILSRLNAIESAFAENWLARNREGGLKDSLSRFAIIRARNQS